MSQKKDAKNKEEQVLRFDKSQILCSVCFEGDKDVLSALLKDDVLYTLDEVYREIEKYKKGKVG